MNPQDFINKIKDGAIDCYKKYQILPSLTIAQAIQESGWGESELAKNANALFGIKAKDDWTGDKYNKRTAEYNSDGSQYFIDAWFRKYTSWDDSINDHGVFLCKDRYVKVRNTNDYKVACTEVYNAGYATDPNYANSLTALIEKYNLQQYDNMTSQNIVKEMNTMLPITDMILTNHNRPKYKLQELKAVVIHWTANLDKGSWATNNRNYFNTTDRACSAHFIVDDHSIIRCIPENEVAWHVGANRYTNYGESLREGSYSPNYYTIGIEMCVNSDGDYNKTYENTIQLTAYLLKKYGLTIDKLVMHNTITGKDCHKWMVDNPALWVGFKQDVISTMSGGTVIVKPSEIISTPQVIPSDRVLKRGCQGNDVRDLQQKLQKLGYYNGKIDGIFGKITDASVRRLQTDKNIKVDGVVGSQSRRTIEDMLTHSSQAQSQSSNSVSYNPYALLFQKACNQMGIRDDDGNRLDEDGKFGTHSKQAAKKAIVKRGDRNALVGVIQTILHIKVDNSYGSFPYHETYDAIGNFQKSHGLKKDYVVGQNTWTALLG